ncbi:WG repeat-containing protein [candidate division KSB1 bacterium]|nr:WG repeat-containing protein [candidate division KSB1 bacterium]
MTKSIFRILLIQFFITLTGIYCGNPPQLVPVEENNKWGYMDEKGTWVIPPRFMLAQNFLITGIAAVVDDSGWMYIDRKGKQIIRPFVFDNGPDYFCEGLARFTVNNKFGYFNIYGKIVIPPRFDFARPFSNGLAAVCEGGENRQEGEHTYRYGGKWGFVNKSGQIIVPLQYDEVKDFRDGHARVRSGEEWKTMNTEEDEGH